MVPGDRLGAYELLALLGAGGMGEVYRARDGRLNRDVAVKVLPGQVSNDPDRLRRFEQEARAASALNHPNILTVYDVGTHEGTQYLVAELLEGQTLAERIDGHPLPLRKAIDYAAQLVRGLAAAHVKGIVHRDLKPANVFVTSDGRIKILDFGIAKLLPAFDRHPDDAATITAPPATSPGVVIGTVGYMAPEQVRGVAADERSDIFSFGVVFYEMLTGRRAFRRDTAADTMSAILTDDPLEVSSGERAFPPDVERILRHCLEKNPDERFQSASDLAFHLESIPAVLDSRAPAGRPPMKVARWILGGLALAALIAAAALRFTPPAEPGGVARFTIELPAGVELRESLALSPDGRTLVYAAADAGGSRLYKRRVDMLESVPIRGSEGGTAPFFSPDGASVGFSDDRLIKWVPLEGGVATTIAERYRNSNGGAAAWLADDTIVYAVESSGLQSVPLSGGPVRQLTELDSGRGELEHRWPIPIPGGRAVSFTVHYGARDTQRVHAVSLDSGARTMLVEGNGARFLPSGHIVFQRLGSLWAARFDPDRLALTSPPVAVIDNVGIASDWSPIVAATSAGSLAYATGGQPYMPRTLVWVDRSGREQHVEAPRRSWFWPQISPDGKRIGFHDMNPVNMDVWLYDLEQAALIRMTFDPRQDGYPVWSPDGKRIAFWSRQHGEAANMYVRSADLTGTDRRLTTSPNYQLPYSWVDGGKLLVFQENTRDTGTDIGIVAVDGTATPTVLIRTPSDEAHPAVSPDGRWIAYDSNLSGRPEVYVQPFPDLGGRWQVSTQGGASPVWHPNGRELFFRSNRAMMGVAVDAAGAFKYGSPRKLFEDSYVTDDEFGRNYAMAPDGRFLMMKEDPAPPPQMVVIVNWAEELRRLPK